jgi:hypothetical protein
MGTMTLQEAERVFDIVTDVLQDTRHLHVPVSALKGYDIYQICTALKLRVANEFLVLAGREDFEEQFGDGLKLYDTGPWHISMRVVPDEQADDIHAETVFNLIDPSTLSFNDERLAAEETASSFGEYCKSIGQSDPIYWQKIYTRLGLDYTSASPRGNQRFIPDSPYSDDQSSLVRATDPFKHVTSYLVAALFALVGSGISTALFVAASAVLAEGANWALSVAHLSVRLRWGITSALLSPLFVRMVLSISPIQDELPSELSKLESWIVTVFVSFFLVVFAFCLRMSEVVRLEYSFFLGGTLFIFSYSEMLAFIRQCQRTRA